MSRTHTGCANAHYVRLGRDGNPDLDRPVGVPGTSLVPTTFGTCADKRCDQPVKTRGLCQLHHGRWLRDGDPDFERRRHPGPTDEAVDVAWMTPREVCTTDRPDFAIRIFDAPDHFSGPVALLSHDGTRLVTACGDDPALDRILRRDGTAK